jgi:hypothetical protein
MIDPLEPAWLLGSGQLVIFDKTGLPPQCNTGLDQPSYRGPFFSLLVIYIPFEVIH